MCQFFPIPPTLPVSYIHRILMTGRPLPTTTLFPRPRSPPLASTQPGCHCRHYLCRVFCMHAECASRAQAETSHTAASLLGTYCLHPAILCKGDSARPPSTVRRVHHAGHAGHAGPSRSALPLPYRPSRAHLISARTHGVHAPCVLTHTARRPA